MVKPYELMLGIGANPIIKHVLSVHFKKIICKCA